MKATLKIRWPMVLFILIALVALGAGVYSVARGATILTGIFLCLFILFAGLMLAGALNVLFAPFFSTFVDALLEAVIFYVAKNLKVGLVFVLTVLSLNIIWGIILLLPTYEIPAESAIKFIHTGVPTTIFLFFLLVLSMIVLLVARVWVEPPLSKPLAALIPPDLVIKNPQAATEHAFTIFEDHLRQRLEALPETYGETLINAAYGKDGALLYGAVGAEQQGVRNLLSGAYATFRNPRKHRLVKEDARRTKAILVLIDLLVQIVDDSESRGPAKP